MIVESKIENTFKYCSSNKFRHPTKPIIIAKGGLLWVQKLINCFSMQLVIIVHEYNYVNDVLVNKLL